MVRKKKQFLQPILICCVGGLLACLVVSLFSTEAKAASRSDNSAVAGIELDIEYYISNMTDDELGVTVDLSQVLNSDGMSTESYPDYAGKCMAVVDNALNVREAPSTEGRIIGKMLVGSVADVTERGEEWSRIQSGNVDGYVNNEYLVFDDDAGRYAQQVCKMVATVQADALMVREGPGTDYSILERAVQGQDLELLEQQGEWDYVSLEDGRTGYVAAEFVEVHFGTKPAYSLDELASTKRMQIVNYGLQFVGNPYVWGGTSLTNGTDCSGFTMRVYQNFGYQLNRSSRAQFNNGVPVDINNLQPGDLVFYAYSDGTIHHVAIYIGNGQIVHANDSSTGIIVSSAYYKTPYGARRIILD